MRERERGLGGRVALVAASSNSGKQVLSEHVHVRGEHMPLSSWREERDDWQGSWAAQCQASGEHT